MEYLSSLLVLVFSILQVMAAGREFPPPCPSSIYCHGPLLHTVQMAGLYKDSKTFVDMKMKYAPAQILKNFDLFVKKHGPNPKKPDVAAFVNQNFDAEGSEFEPWDPADWHDDPSFLKNISDPKYKAWAHQLHSFWKELGRKIKDDVKIRPELYSMIYSDHPVIVPGGRFREIFYWDSFWIMRGLLLSEMQTTVKGMLLNFVQMVSELGYVPNGGRVYFRRSQPPLLIPMVKLYIDATSDINFLRENIHVLDQEFQFWIRNRTVNISVKGRNYQMVRYNVEMDGPRPESYREDFELAEGLGSEQEKRELYFNLKSAAESGWDFSSRWFIAPEGESGALIHTKTRHIIPVELNSFMFLNAKTMSEFYDKLGNREKSMYYRNIANTYKTAIEDVFWDDDEGSWFDYDMTNNKLRKTYYSSNIVPLWVEAHSSPKQVTRVISHLTKVGVLKERGGVPTSSIQSGEQWDYPNGWAPLQYFLVDALAKADDQEANDLAFKLADKWIKTNYKAFLQSKPHHMFEKYDVTVEGIPGGGGEYDVVVGFGWTNGVVMDFLNRYGDRLSVPLSAENTGARQILPPGSIAISMLTIAVTLLGITHVLRAYRALEREPTPTPARSKSARPTVPDVNGNSDDTTDNEESVSLMRGSVSSPPPRQNQTRPQHNATRAGGSSHSTIIYHNNNSNKHNYETSAL